MEYQTFTQQKGFLEKLDIFGIDINIRFNKESNHTTKIGGIITVGILAILSYQIKLIIDTLYDSTHPYVLYEQKFTSEPQLYNLTSDKFILTFGLQNSTSQHYIDETVYKATLLIKQIIKQKNNQTGQIVSLTSSREVKIEPCREDHFDISLVDNYFLSLNYKKLYCISKDETELYLQGQFDANRYSTLELKVQSCSGNNCNPNMNQMLQYCRLAVYYVDYSVIPSDRSNPFQPLGRQSFWISGPEFTKNTYLNSDYGLMGSDLQTTNALTFSTDREQVSPKSGNLLYDCFISLEKNLDNYYHRSYQKLDKSLSQLGGIFNILFTVGALICRPLSQIELNLKLVSRLFNFEDPEGNNKKKNDKKQKPKSKQENEKKEEEHTQAVDQILMAKEDQQKTQFEENQISFNKKYQFQSSGQKSEGDESNIFQSRQKQSVDCIHPSMRDSYRNKLKPLSKFQTKKNKQDIANEANQLKGFFSFSDNKISFQGWEYYANFFRFSNLCKKRRHKLLQKGIDKLYNQIDIFYLVQKLLEVEKLKQLLLNENQIKLFEFIPKPILTLDEKQSNNLSDKVGLLYDQKDIFHKTNDAQQAFQQIVSSKTKPSKIDVRILELLDPHFKLFLQDLVEVQKQSTNLKQNPFEDSQSKINMENKNDYILEDLHIAIEESNYQQNSSYFNQFPNKSLGSIYSIHKNNKLASLHLAQCHSKIQ